MTSSPKSMPPADDPELAAAPGLAEIEAAAARLAGQAVVTPLLESPALNEAVGGRVLLKAEPLQRTGSFKFRGAFNKISQIPEAARAAGVVAYSSGNHAQGVAAAARLLGLPANIVMPADAPAIKIANTRALGAEVVFYDRHGESREEVAERLLAERGATLVPPYDDPDIVAGQGTVGLEIFADAPDLDHVIIAIGGGGLISGIATALKALKPEIRVSGVEPVGAPTLTRSLEAGEVVTLPEIATAAGTLAPSQSAALNLGIVTDRVDEIVLVEDEEMRAAARWLWHELGIAAELSGAAAMAALLQGRIAVQPGARVCALVCGAGTDGLD